jgi:hypothetical protein
VPEALQNRQIRWLNEPYNRRRSRTCKLEGGDIRRNKLLCGLQRNGWSCDYPGMGPVVSRYREPTHERINTRRAALLCSHSTCSITNMNTRFSRLLSGFSTRTLMVGLNGTSKNTVVQKLDISKIETIIPTSGFSVEAVQ